jgi:serine/threonine-protein kinase
VYQALERVTHRTIAVKALLCGPFASAGAELDERVVRLREISHANLVSVFGSGQHGGLPYVAMEFADCGNLTDRLQFGACDFRQASRLAHSLAAGLSALHDAGLVHGNLKPNNVLLTAEGVWKLSDMHWTSVLPDVLNLGCIVERPAAARSLFELAKELRGQIGLHPPCGLLRTAAGWRMADVRYLAPEAASADYAGPSPAEDVYALGAILYELLTGRGAFGGDSWQEIWSRVLAGFAVSDALTASGVPPDVLEICLSCLAKQPADRPSLGELTAVLGACGESPH